MIDVSVEINIDNDKSKQHTYDGQIDGGFVNPFLKIVISGIITEKKEWKEGQCTLESEISVDGDEPTQQTDNETYAYYAQTIIIQ